MLLQQTLVIAAIAAHAGGRSLNVNKSPLSIAQVHRDQIWSPNSAPRDALGYDRQSTKVKRDGAIFGFEDEDYASDADWQRFTNKGGALMCALDGDDKEAGLQMGDKRTPPSAASPWTGDLKQELATWKWTEVNPSSYSCKIDDYWDLYKVTEALGLNGKPKSQGGDNVCYRVEHWDPKQEKDGQRVPAINQWYNVDGTEYQATDAHFEFGVNTRGGAIYGFFLDSAVNAASTLWHNGRKPADPSKLPSLRAFSDILWGHWNRDNPDIKNIKYFFMIGIVNDETNQLIATCLGNANKRLSEWPGTQFDTSTDEGHALLGSPNGAAFAYFLMQHKRELGMKTIEKVTVFKAESEYDNTFVDPCLAFHVSDVEGTRQGKRERSARAFKL